MSTHDPIQHDLQDPMKDIARVLAKALHPFGFALLVFPLGDDQGTLHRINYISNARREDMIVAMKEFIARAEGMDIEVPQTRQ